MSSPEKRAHHRGLLSLFVGSKAQRLGVTKDVSLGGLFVETKTPPALGTEQEVTFVWDLDVYSYQTMVVREMDEGVGLAFLTRDAERDGVLQEMLRS